MACTYGRAGRVVGALSVVFLGVGVVSAKAASLAGPGGQFHGCAGKHGVLSVIAYTARCPGGERNVATMLAYVRRDRRPASTAHLLEFVAADPTLANQMDGPAHGARCRAQPGRRPAIGAIGSPTRS